MTLRTRMACMVILLLLGCVFAAPFYQTENSKNQSTESTLPTLQIQWGSESTTGVEAPTSKAKPTSTHTWVQPRKDSDAKDAAGSKSEAQREDVSEGRNPILSRKTRAIFSRPIPDLDIPAIHASSIPGLSRATSADGTPPSRASRETTAHRQPTEHRVLKRPLATLGQPVASRSVDTLSQTVDDLDAHSPTRARPWLRNSATPGESLSGRRSARRFEATDIQWPQREARGDFANAGETMSGSVNESGSANDPRHTFERSFTQNDRAMQVAHRPSTSAKSDSSRIHTTLTSPMLTTERRLNPIQDQHDSKHVRESQTVLTPVSSQLASGRARSSGVHQEWENDTPQQQVDNLDRQTRWHRISRFDNLSELSKKYYGTPEFALFIFEANRQSLASPDILPLGLELIIPARANGHRAPTRPHDRSSGSPVAPLSPVQVQYGWRGAYEE